MPAEESIPESTFPPTPEAKQWAMFIHFSLFAGYIIPIAGLIVPLVLWQMKKDQFPFVDTHGKIVMNWILSALIYFVICFITSFIVIGALGFIVLALVSIIFPIMGGIKASNGETWPYPLTIKFIK